ncbi:3-oxoacyl-[acyl-carrier-protein] reductase [Anaerosalibacter bizertensis]|uniref:3-oxoacyl-[acyl-carrier-protein] reductase n=1 Tax=Anaerosalibacter bizertensis TaxID=932217 RepID=A0A9Q4ADJ9_9FIRM|nr:3-oxoacyl-[acyl-carrier-protein] reductase [Anaerosalibacter bizertensis]MCG4565439.1 3-oxoacyl-[acyl-carrier-protein] reductase [Anaerosalibacter bizertensis]MCG4582308.1 3-oxoacyl-[acyl-carrier-protein] reductase [Anaerosalibacter bizertensis]MCG4584950.1 3-oxoacyl-[acyl-carrier-protein] reductase [Anaerosalibacter bizertensis]
MLKEKNALVTGGSRGIGRATAIELSKEGANVIITYNSNEEKAKEVIKEIEKNGVKGLAIKADVSSEEDVKSMMKTIKSQFDSIDVLVNNAGVTKDNLLIRMKSEDWDKVINTNLKGVYLCTKAVVRGMMKKRHGKIVNIASVVGISGNAGQGNYSASKAGVIGFTKSIAKELGSRGINVNGVAPGFVETDMTEVLSEDIKEQSLKLIPLERFAKPEDIANVVVFLCSEKANYITGQIINVDGGMLM